MGSIKRLTIATEISARDRKLADTLSKSPVIGDPDVATLSSIEVERAWKNLDQLDTDAIPGLVRLSRQLDVPVPSVAGKSTVDALLGAPPVDGLTKKPLRRTRIVATVGPSCADVETLAKMIKAGMDVARVNFSHINDPADAKAWVDRLNQAMVMAGRKIEILADLRGPKIRIGDIEEEKLLEKGKTVTLGPGGALPITPAHIASDLAVGQRLFIDDGKIALKVTNTDSTPIQAQVLRGGPVKKRKGVNLPDTEVSVGVPTEKDLADIQTIEALGISLVAVSFVENGADMDRVRSKFKNPVRLMAKIERPKAVENIDEIFKHSEGLMVARGDGAVEMGDEHMPVIQRQIHTKGNKLEVPTGTATQMMESMIDGGRPSRSDASDVARAALEGSDFVMTSGESAVGKDPVAVMSAMSKILETTERAIRTGTVSVPN